jgi:hypothetical protein
MGAKKYLACVVNQLEEEDKGSIDWPVTRAANYAFLDDYQNAFNMLNYALDHQDLEIALWIRTSIFDILKPNPRYADLIRKLKLEKNVNLDPK